tara:strand:+ start:416 stop:1318 length:903 start_codon:yes stop_codon:yes gene_type:complete
LVDKLDVLGLKAFISVAEQGSFRKAAESLNLTSTAVSRRVQKIEESLGVVLITRTTRQVTLTRLGAEFLPRAQEMLGAVEEIFSDLRNRGRYGERRITIACLATVASFHMPKILEQFAKVHPDVRVELLDVSATRILESIRNEKADFGISFVGADHYDLATDFLYSEPLVAWTARESALARRPSVTWAELRDYPLIAIAKLSGTRRVVEEALEAHGIDFEFDYEVQQLHTAVSLAGGGVGVAVLPRIAADEKLSNVVAVPVEGPKVSRSIGLLRRNDRPLSPLVNQLRSMILARFRSGQS